jgi:hypothetical protein
MNDDENPIDKILSPHLRHILEVFGRKPETGKTPLESLPPSQRLVANAPLNKQEWMIVHWGDMRFREKMFAEKKGPINQTGHSDGILEPSPQGLPQSLKKTLTQVLHERGIKDAPPDDPIYQTKYELRLRSPLRRSTQMPPKPSETGGLEGPSQQQLIDRISKKPEDTP